MIDGRRLLPDLQALLPRIEADLLERSESADVPDVGRALRDEFARARTAERTAQNYKNWRSDAITQVAAAWVLSCVFVRFLEDNRLIEPPRIAGPDARLQRARDEHELYFHEHPRQTDREYLLAVFDGLTKHAATRDVFGAHNPIRDLPNWLSGDAAGALIAFFQRIDPNTGVLVHNFTDPEWDTRFLGDLYQDLSEAARKKYALLQTPVFVEEFILDRTLDPALAEFGLARTGYEARLLPDGRLHPDDRFKMIDPACDSGHFLLASFARLVDRWRKKDPGAKVSVLVQRALDGVHGVDVNPYAIAIARFRLLLAALKECGITRLSDAPGFAIHLACGDSLLHGVLLQRLEDPRSTINQRHPLDSVVVIALLAVLAGAGGPTAITRWAALKEELLLQVLDLPHGVPRKDVFRRVLMVLKPAAFQACFANWLRSLRTEAAAETSGSSGSCLVTVRTSKRATDHKENRLSKQA